MSMYKFLPKIKHEQKHEEVNMCLNRFKLALELHLYNGQLFASIASKSVFVHNNQNILDRSSVTTNSPEHPMIRG